MSASSTPGNASSADAKSQQIVPRMTPEQLEALDKKVKGGDNFVQAVVSGGSLGKVASSWNRCSPARPFHVSQTCHVDQQER